VGVDVGKDVGLVSMLVGVGEGLAVSLEHPLMTIRSAITNTKFRIILLFLPI
jgi:hypothetical protein